MIGFAQLNKRGNNTHLIFVGQINLNQKIICSWWLFLIPFLSSFFQPISKYISESVYKTEELHSKCNHSVPSLAKNLKKMIGWLGTANIRLQWLYGMTLIGFDCRIDLDFETFWNNYPVAYLPKTMNSLNWKLLENKHFQFECVIMCC